MAEEKNESNKTNNEQPSRQVSVAAQYIKDVSFESPAAPQSLRPTEERPDINVSVDVKATTLGEDTYEVSLKIGANASRGDKNVFICEVEYCGVFVVKGVPEDEMQPTLLIFCPGLLFPYIRSIISGLTRDGGFPPLMLDPIDFGRLYAQKKTQENTAENKAN